MLTRVPFDPNELISDKTYPPGWNGMPGPKMYNLPASPVANQIALFEPGDMPLWIPLGSDRLLIAPRLDADNIARGMVMDATPLQPEEIDALATVGGKDKFGIEWIYVPLVRGSMVKPGNPLMTDANDWEKLVQFPDVASWDWEGSIAVNKPVLENDPRAVYAWVQTGLFERLISFMDFQGAALAVIDEDQKDAVKALMNRLADTYIDIIAHYKKAYDPLIFCLHDDWGSQRAPFFSLNTVMEMIVPALSRVVQAVHDNGMYFDMHSCGKNEMLVPAYIAAGCDSWGGQPMNDKSMLYDMYGDKLILGIDPDITITADTPAEEAVAAAKRFVAKYGPTMDKKPFTCSGGGASLPFVETLYEESRKMFS